MKVLDSGITNPFRTPTVGLSDSGTCFDSGDEFVFSSDITAVLIGRLSPSYQR